MTNLPASDDANVQRENVQVPLALGQWYWVKDTERSIRGRKEVDEPIEWLGCVMAIGSNYVELHSPHGPRGYRTKRVHLDDFWTALRAEPNAPAVIAGNVSNYEERAKQLLGEVQALTARLGLTPMHQLAAPNEGPSTALVALSAAPDIGAYQNALVKAKDTDLPALFAEIKANHELLATWLGAAIMPTKAMAGDMEETIEGVKDRLFNITLYAGLTEQAVPCCDGTPAGAHEKLHVMQRRGYMDEECLLNYEAGGMEFKDIEAFDAWLCRPENRDRVLPFPRTLVALRVRREDKNREWDGSFAGAFIHLNLQQADKHTFLYIRNGERVARISTDLQFGEMIFPDRTMFDPAEPKMVKMFANRVDTMISLAQYEQEVAEFKEQEAQRKAWRKANPGKSDWDNPHRHSSFRFNPDEWKPFDKDNVYFDDCLKEINDRVKKYNRIAVIIQGLFDRSDVLHPHPPVRSWTAEGFEQAITLVYDGDRVLTAGEAPDFEAYRARINASLTAGSIAVGQDDFWMRKMAEVENERRHRHWNGRGNFHEYQRHRPYGNPGPGALARIAEWKPGAKKAVFRWQRRRLQANNFTHRAFEPIACTITVPGAELLNVSAYTPGDFKQFFADTRTRAQYLKWAPLMLMAEDYYAGKRKVHDTDAALDD